MRFAQVLALALLSLAARLPASTISVQSDQIRILGDTVGFNHWAETLSGGDLIYVGATKTNTSHIVFNYSGIPFDMQTTVAPPDVLVPMTAVQLGGNGVGSYIYGVKAVGSLHFGQRFTIVNNPRSGVGADTIEYRLNIENTGSFASTVAARLMIDVQLLSATYDNAPLSLDNGLTSITNNSVFNGAAVPEDWWAFNVLPGPALSATGAVLNNPFGLPATRPDAMEFVHWDEIAGTGHWAVHKDIGKSISASYARADTAVVLWFTGPGNPFTKSSVPAPNYSLPAGATIEFVAYYGLSQSTPQKTPTPAGSPTVSPTISPTPSISPTRSPSATISPTFSISPTFTVSPTISPTHTLTPTFSVSPTFSHSPTVTDTFTPSPSFSASPTATVTATATPSFTASPTFSHSPTASPTPTLTLTHTVTPTHSASPTYSASPTPSPSFTVSQTFTVSPTYTVSATPTATQPPLVLTGKPANPNPSDGSGVWLPYVLSRDALVLITVYTVAGEKVKALSPFDGLQGANEQFWDEKNEDGAMVASGVFIYRITARAGGEQQSVWLKLSVLR